MSPRTATGGAGGRAARARRRPLGRTLVFAGLLAFLLVATGVIWRRSLGIARARELRALDARRVALEGERAALESEVRMAASRGRVAGVAQTKLGMRVPADTQVILLTRPASGALGPPAAGAAVDTTP